MATASVERDSLLNRLLGFVDKDPSNTGLLAEAAAAAYDARDFDRAADLIERYAAIQALPAPLRNLEGLIAMAGQKFADAAEIFDRMRREGDDNPALRFNLAWSKAMVGAYREALALLDDDTVAVSPRGPALKIQMMHHLELYAEAMACGDELVRRYPSDERLMGALATLAIDAERTDLARLYAERAGNNPEGSAALGVLMLGDNDARGAMALFEHAVSQQPDNARAWVGKGLALLSLGDAAAGAKAIDRGAELFGDHLGSWIASGWSHFLAGDRAGARAAFERAIAADANFSESHGGLAVLDLVEGKLESAKQRAEIAVRLDKNSFGGALARSLLLERAGHAQAAQKIREIALSTPIGPSGQTIGQALVKMAGGQGKTRDPAKRGSG